MEKQRVLIGLYGLSRTFKQTSKLLFDRIIYPNLQRFTFDIMINTDFTAESLTAGRPDIRGTTSAYKYDDEQLFRDELTECYNIHCQLKDITIYNRESHFLVHPFFVIYKRIQQILAKAHETEPAYDIYIIMRMDTTVDRVVDLSEINNDVVLVSGNFTRDFYLHNRDIIDTVFYGNRTPFMYWILSMIQTFSSITKLKAESIDFFDTRSICDDAIVQQFNELRSKINENDVDAINRVINKVKLRHSPCQIADHYIFNGNRVAFDLNQYYQLSPNYLLCNIIYGIQVILGYHNFSLSETKYKIVYTVIVR